MPIRSPGITIESPTPTPTQSPTQSLISSLQPPPPTSTWLPLGAGVERREFAVRVPDTSLLETLILFRLDPQSVTFRVHYTPGKARMVSSWARELQADSPPMIVLNAGFFTDDYRSTALIVADGQAEGSTYVDFGGMFYAQNGEARVRSLTVEPWQASEVFEQAVQGFPVLVRPGRTPFTKPDGDRSRRTVIAQASSGQIVIAVAPHYTLRLVELAEALLDPELDIAIAVNLDGGSSTGYWAGREDNLDSEKPVPAVIAAYSK